MPEIIVIGAGVSGLTAAHALRAGGRDVIVLDQGALPGGRVRSERVGGFLMEHGANSLVGPAPVANGLVRELGLAAEMVTRGAAARHRYLVRGGRARALPVTPARFLLSSYLSLAGRLRLLMEPFVAPQDGDESVAAFARRRLGPEMLDYVLDPLVGGLYAGNPEQLSVSAVLPRLKRLERDAGSVILGAVRSRAPCSEPIGARAPGPRTLFSFRQGLGELPRAMARGLGGRVFLGQRVESVQRMAPGRIRVRVRCRAGAHRVTAQSVVVALPAFAAARVLAGLDGEIAQTLASLGHPPLAVVFLGYGRGAIGHPLDGVGVLVPAAEKRGVLGMLFSSTLFPGRAPAGHVALTAFVGGARQPQLAGHRPEELVALVHREVQELFGASAPPAVAHARCWSHGLPQPGTDHAQRLAAIAAFESEHAGVFLTGNYFGGVSTAACAEQAYRTAQRVEAYLAERTEPVFLAA